MGMREVAESIKLERDAAVADKEAKLVTLRAAQVAYDTSETRCTALQQMARWVLELSEVKAAQAQNPSIGFAPVIGD